MPLGEGGRYDDLMLIIGEALGPKGQFVLVVLDGARGPSLGIAVDVQMMAVMPNVLRGVADQVESTGQVAREARDAEACAAHGDPPLLWNQFLWSHPMVLPLRKRVAS